MPSSVIRAFDHDPAAQRLTIAFVSGRIYVFDAVPAPVADAFRRAESKGDFFDAEIRNHYRHRELRRPAILDA